MTEGPTVETATFRKLSSGEGAAAAPISNTNPLPTDSAQYTQKMENTGDGQPLYMGEALPGTATSAATWRIRKMEYDNGTQRPPTGVLWADGVSTFTKVWDDRSTGGYVYS